MSKEELIIMDIRLKKRRHMYKINIIKIKLKLIYII